MFFISAKYYRLLIYTFCYRCNTCYLRDLIPGSFLGTGFTDECEFFFCTSDRGVEPAGIVSEGVLMDEDFFPLAALAFVSSDDVAIGGDRYIFGEFVIAGVDAPIAPVHRKVFINIDV